MRVGHIHRKVPLLASDISSWLAGTRRGVVVSMIVAEKRGRGISGGIGRAGTCPEFTGEKIGK